MNFEENEIAINVLIGLSSSYKHLIVALDANIIKDPLCTFEFVKFSLVQEEQQFEMHEDKERKGSEASVVFSHGCINHVIYLKQTGPQCNQIAWCICENCGCKGHTICLFLGCDVNGRSLPLSSGYRTNGLEIQ